MNRYRSLPNPQSLLDQLAALSEADFSAMQNAYFYRWLQLVLRSLGWLNLILGGFTLWLGLSGIELGILKIIQTAFGVLIIALSLWGLIAPSRQALFGYSIMFALAGAWNLFLGVKDGIFGSGLLIALLGLLQLRWSYQYYRKYYPHIPLNVVKPSKETVALYDAIWREFAMTRHASSEQLLEFVFMRERWRGFIFGDYFALASPKRKLIIFARKSEIEFAAKNPEQAHQKLNGVFTFNQLANKASIQHDFFERYMRWKAGT